jgi:hypothetical protein
MAGLINRQFFNHQPVKEKKDQTYEEAIVLDFYLIICSYSILSDQLDLNKRK